MVICSEPQNLKFCNIDWPKMYSFALEATHTLGGTNGMYKGTCKIPLPSLPLIRVGGPQRPLWVRSRCSIAASGFMVLGYVKAGSHKLALWTRGVSQGVSVWLVYLRLAQMKIKNSDSLSSARLVNRIQTKAGGGDRSASEDRGGVARQGAALSAYRWKIMKLNESDNLSLLISCCQQHAVVEDAAPRGGRCKKYTTSLSANSQFADNEVRLLDCQLWGGGGSQLDPWATSWERLKRGDASYLS